MSCTTLLTEAYPNQLKKKNMGPDEILSRKGMTSIGGYGRVAKSNLKEKVISKGIYPALKSAKWGLGAAALAYGASKLKKKMEASKS